MPCKEADATFVRKSRQRLKIVSRRGYDRAAPGQDRETPVPQGADAAVASPPKPLKGRPGRKEFRLGVAVQSPYHRCRGNRRRF